VSGEQQQARGSRRAEVGGSGRGDRDITIHIGHDELVIRRRYETASIANDVLTGLLFVVGSVMFFYDATMTAGIWLFVIGSVLMVIRPVIRLTRRVHLTSLRGGDVHGSHESSMDF
jgi:hypothetical protein